MLFAYFSTTYIVLGQEDGVSGEGSLGRRWLAAAKVLDATAGLLAQQGRQQGNPRAGAMFWLLWTEPGLSVHAAHWGSTSASGAGLGREESPWKGADGERSHSPAPGLLLQLCSCSAL